jgi:hypothetical protein
MNQRIHLRGRISEMAADAVAGLIGAGQMARIQSVDSAPFFFEMVLAHEGQSRGSLNGLQIVKEWIGRVVRAVAHAFSPQGRIPASLYDGIDHWHGNEGQRVPVGEVVEARPVVVEGVETARAIGWVYPQFASLREGIRTGARDCCSIEADVEAATVNGRMVVQEVLRGVAVVLGHTSKQTPGFAGAKIRKLTEFGPVETGSEEPSDANQGQEGQSKASEAAGGAPPSAPKVSGVGGQGSGSLPTTEHRPPTTTLTKEQLVAAIQAANLKPADVWPELQAQPQAPPQPPPAPIATPPEQKQAEVVDPLSAAVNPFLPG